MGKKKIPLRIEFWLIGWRNGALKGLGGDDRPQYSTQNQKYFILFFFSQCQFYFVSCYVPYNTRFSIFPWRLAKLFFFFLSWLLPWPKAYFPRLEMGKLAYLRAGEWARGGLVFTLFSSSLTIKYTIECSNWEEEEEEGGRRRSK